jgi:hypothetical protein
MVERFNGRIGELCQQTRLGALPNDMAHQICASVAIFAR